MPRLRVPTLLTLAALAAGCASTPPSVTDDATGAMFANTQERIASVLAGLPPCGADPDEQEVGEVPGLVLPDGAVPLKAAVDGPLTTVDAWVGLNPVEVKQWYESSTLGVLKALMVEDEILEAELLMESRTHRLYIKAQSACRDASRLWVVVAEHGAGTFVPAPGSTDAPGPPPLG